MNESINEPPAAPKPRSALPLVLLIIFAPALFCGLQAVTFSIWSFEQIAGMGWSIGRLDLIDAGGLFVLAILLTIITGLLYRFTRSERFRPVFASWFWAALVSFPAIGLRFLGPNNDQTGMLVQIAICVVGAALAWRFKRDRMAWNWRTVPAALMVAAVGLYPLVTMGAIGSLSDFGLSLLAGLCFGLFAALLFSPTTGNVFLDALGIAGVLALLALALGYDGGQIILLITLPLFAFAIAALMPSLAGASLLTGLVAAASLAFIDPTELSLVLGDFTTIGLSMAYKVLGLGLLAGVAALIARFLLKKIIEAKWSVALGAVIAGLLWVGLVFVYFTLGHPGYYGDRIFVIFKAQADLSNVAAIPDVKQRRVAAYQEMTQLANDSQAAIRKDFDTFGIKYTPYYLVNGMEVQGGTLVHLFLMTRPEVDRVIPSPHLRPIPPVAPETGTVTSVDGAPQWNIQMIGADKVWSEFGVRGQGVVVGQSDSGVDGNHPAIRDQYRGHASGDNNYNWYDPWSGTKFPVDIAAHGTHTLGTILGKDGIGIAPDAQWIACVNLKRNLGDPAFYLDCMQFMLAPFPQGGDPFKDGDPTKAADVLNNSWGCPDLEGCDPTSLQAAADHLRAAGIFVVVSAGNDGPACDTSKYPLSLYASVFSVGAIDRNGDMADFSSRGPVTADGSDRMKPDIVAPGVGVLSSTPEDTYATFSGTSMAGPHVVGAVALLWSAVPSLVGDIDRTDALLIHSASAYTGSRSSGCFQGDLPNAAFGNGVLNVYQAVKMALGK